MIKRILSWKQKALYVGGRLILIKHVLSSIPIHLLVAAPPPKCVLLELEKIMAGFLWGSSDLGSRAH